MTLNAAFWCYLKWCFGSWNNWKIIISRTLNGAFWRYLKQCFESWSCWEHVESQDANWGIFTLFVMIMFIYFGIVEKILQTKTPNGAFLRNLKWCFWSWNCWESLKTKTLNGAFWRYLKLCFGSLNCWENFEIILMQFESVFWKWVLLRKCWKWRHQLVHFNIMCNNVLEVGTAENCFKSMMLNGAFWRYFKWCFSFSNLWLSIYICQTPLHLHIYCFFRL